jgi:hypothetical protein
MFALNSTPKTHFQISRNEWLAAFWQKHFGQDPIEMERQLVHLTTSPEYSGFSTDDGELRAALIYVAGTSLRYRLADNFNELRDPGSENGIAKYKERFMKNMKKGSSPPVLGKLVYMADIRLNLEESTTAIESRLKTAGDLCDELLSFSAYQTYAPALALRANIRALNLELKQRSLETGPIKNEDAAKMSEDEGKLLAPIQEDFTTAVAFDPDLMRFVRFRSLSMSKGLVDNLAKINETEAGKRAALKDDQGQSVVATAEEQLKQFAFELDGLVRPILGLDLVVRPKVEEQLFQRIRQELGERDLKVKVENARSGKLAGDKALDKYKKFDDVYALAEQLGKLHIAEAWLLEINNVIDDAPESFKNDEKNQVAEKLKKLREADVAKTLLFVF